VNPIWTKSKWKAQELDGQSVEFRIPIADGVWSGVAEFWATGENERVSVELVTNEPGKDWAQRIQRIWILHQVAVDRIEEHPDQTVARFRLQ
jgi:hypothetical protein